MSTKKNINSVLVMAGETSGDYLGASILQYLKKSNIKYWGCGGEKMKNIGVDILYSIQSLEVIGATEVLKKYFFLKKVLNQLIEESIQRNIKHAILIDYPGFNLALAKRLSTLNIKCYMIVSPQIWAWRYKRIYKIKKYISAILCLFKFEVDIYQKEGIQAHFIGHPLIQECLNHKRKWSKVKKNNSTRKIVLLPGSRQKEIQYHLPYLLAVVEQYPKYKYILPVANHNMASFIKGKYKITKNIKISTQNIHENLFNAYAAIACSGTVTLECAMFEVPYILIYKTSYITYYIAQMVVTTKFLGIINILSKKKIVEELIQTNLKKNDLFKEVNRLLNDDQYRRSLKKAFNNIEQEYKNKKPSQEASMILKKIIY